MDLINHTQNTLRIVSYLSYLRDISRKIISRNGFEKCLLNKNLGFAIQFDDLPLKISIGDSLYEEIHKYFSFIQKNQDKKLFLGFGTCIGKEKRIFAAPIIIVQCEILKDEHNQDILIEPDMQTLNLNYDFLSALSTNYLNEEDDVLNPLSEDENKTVEGIESLLKELNGFDSLELSSMATAIFDDLNKKIERFKGIAKMPIINYDFKKELAKYTFRQIRNTNGNGSNKKEEKEKSVFEKELVYVNANHLFISLIPDQLSTYEALNSFVQNITEENDFQNPVVEKLLANALTDDRVPIDRGNIEERIQKIVDTFIPVSLSNSQIQGLKNAWANEISYIQGPPGTGKSYTISAIVLSAIALGKKVLVISQKTAALQVVNTKIEPLLSDGDGLTGICYYDKSERKKIKDYCNFLLNQASNTSQFTRYIGSIKTRINELETGLHNKLEELKCERSKLDKSLDKQRQYKEANETFLIELKRIGSDFFEIPNGFQFQKIKDEGKYRQVIARVEKIFENNANSLAARLYVKKFKDHLQSKFNVPAEWLESSSFLYFSKAFVNINKLFTDTKNIIKELNTDTTSVRKRIKNIKLDIEAAQTQLIKLKFKLNVLEKVNGPDYQEEINKFDRMLYNTNSHLIDKKMKDIDFNKIIDVIPFWTAEIRNLGHLFPLAPNLFDLVVVDEASQVNLAEILPAFYRAKRICIVGDHHQLSLKASGLNFSLSKNFDELTWEKYNRSLMRYQTAARKKLTVTQASILDFIKSEEYNASIREVMLDEHFRSLPHLARYTSKQFYKDNDNPEGRLKIMTETPDKVSINCFKAVRVNGARVRNEKGETLSKAISAEALEVIKIISCLTNSNKTELHAKHYYRPNHVNENGFTIGIISMIREQCESIKELIEEKLDDNVWSDFNLMIGTPEEFQGNERDIMIISLCLDSECKSGQGHFQDAKRLNVATSRAKYFTYFVYSPFPPTFDKIHNYLKYINGAVTEEDLASSDYEVIRPELPPLDFNKFESDFERYVYSYLDKFANEWNNGHKITLHNQIKSCGQKRLDFVLFNHQTNKSVAVEVDGNYHFISSGLTKNYTIEHIERIEILTRAGWNIVNTPYHKWFNDGWLSEDKHKVFRDEIERIYAELMIHLF